MVASVGLPSGISTRAGTNRRAIASVAASRGIRTTRNGAGTIDSSNMNSNFSILDETNPEAIGSFEHGPRSNYAGNRERTQKGFRSVGARGARGRTTIDVFGHSNRDNVSMPYVDNSAESSGRRTMIAHAYFNA
jgi:hypothetical protein